MSTLQYEDRHQDLAADVWDSLYISLIPLPAALLGTALVSDVLFWLTEAAVYARVSEWMLGAGLATGAIAAANGLVRYLSEGTVQPSKVCSMHVIGNLLALALSASNLIYRLNEDPVRAVVPAGITLSAIVVCLLIATAYLARGLAPEVSDGVDDEDWWT
jgi:uncharacterized membrane protein